MSHQQLKRIGVLGGMGPLATQLFYGMVISNTDAKRDQDHIDMIILNHASMPDRTEALLTGNTQPLYAKLLEDCVFLEKSGVSHIVIPCNTAHFFADKLQAEIKTPIIHMIREVVKDVKETKGAGTKVGVLATDGTIQLGIYQTEMEKAGLIPMIPSEDNQKRIMKMIYDGIKNGGTIEPEDFKEVEKEIRAKGCECVIMGCTELSCLMDLYNLSQDFYIDAMKTLALKTITAAGKNIKPTMD
ncbi:MAG: amino acid racemase [Clostridiales bacterium]|nr:amino acid racemase [Clostridiales bacterium]